LDARVVASGHGGNPSKARSAFNGVNVGLRRGVDDLQIIRSPIADPGSLGPFLGKGFCPPAPTVEAPVQMGA